MDRPYTICHMCTSLDGKIMGKWMETLQDDVASKKYYELILGSKRFYEIDAILVGRITTDDNYTMYKKPELPETAEALPPDYVAPDAEEGYLYITVDPSGKCGWDTNTIEIEGTKFHVVELLTDSVDVRYKSYLKDKGISYITAGTDAMDLPLVMRKLKKRFGVQTLMIGGGGIINWSCIQDGLCDELSIVTAPAADGSMTTQSLFMAKEPFSVDNPVVFNLLEGRAIGDSVMWTRYQCLNAITG